VVLWLIGRNQPDKKTSPPVGRKVIFYCVSWIWMPFNSKTYWRPLTLYFDSISFRSAQRDALSNRLG